MATTQPPKGSQQPEPSATAIGFALGQRQRIVCSIPRCRADSFWMLLGVWDEPNFVAGIALVLGFVLFAAGLLGRLGRFTYQTSTGGRVSYEPDYATSVPKEPPLDQSAPPPGAPEEPDLSGAQIELSDHGVGVDTAQVEKRDPLREAFTASDAKDYSTFDSKMQEAVEAETDDDRKAAFDSDRLQELYAAGQTQRLEELRALRDRSIPHHTTR